MFTVSDLPFSRGCGYSQAARWTGSVARARSREVGGKVRIRLRLTAVTTGLCLVVGFAGSASATVSVGVADSGVAANLGGQVLPGWNFLANSADTTDPVWHGTFVAGLVQAEAGVHAAIVP